MIQSDLMVLLSENVWSNYSVISSTLLEGDPKKYLLLKCTIIYKKLLYL